MNWKRSLRVLATGLVLSLPFAAHAQQVNMYWQTGTGPSGWQPVTSANPLPVSASVSASITGFPGTTQTTGTPISVTTGGVTGTLPAGAVVVASNVGATNGAYCKLGASASTSDQLIPPNSWFGFTVGSNTQLTCITSTSTTTVNMVGGSGLPTGAGGGGGGGGSGGNVTIVGPLGQQLAAASVPIVLTAAQITTLTPPTTVAVTQSTSPWIVAGGGTAGTPGTAVLTIQGVASGTNVPVSLAANQSVNEAQINGVTPLMGNGISGTGSQRVNIASDNTAFAVNATLQASSATAIGTVNPTTAANWGVGATGSAVPANGVLGMMSNAGTAVALQGDGTNGLWVNIKSGAGSGGTAIADNAAFTQSTTNETPASCLFITSYTAATTGHSTVMQCDSTGHPLVNPGTIGSWGLAASTQNGTTPTNMALMAGQFNTTPTTITTGNISPFQMDNAGNLLVNVKAGGGSGGTSSNFSATFPSTGTAAGAEYLSSPPTLTSGQMVALQVTSAGSLHATVDNTNANGSATSANSSPVVIASDQAAVAVKAASGAFVSGSLASGAMVDLTNLSTPIAAATATATKGVLLGGQFDTTQKTLTNGQQAALSASARGALFVAVGADGFAVTNAGTFATQSTVSSSDPCLGANKTNVAIATSSGTVQLVAPSGSTQVYVCSFSLISAAAAVVNLVGGTGATCTTGTPVAALGSTTAASGASLAANGGLTFGSGIGTAVRTTTAGHGLCLIQSGTVALAGNITFVQQ
jgi:trimeric autotransporter adhesin